MHADGGDLSAAGSASSPNAGKPGNAFGWNAEIAASANQNLLEPPNIVNSAKGLAPRWGMIPHVEFLMADG